MHGVQIVRGFVSNPISRGAVPTAFADLQMGCMWTRVDFPRIFQLTRHTRSLLSLSTGTAIGFPRKGGPLSTMLHSRRH